MFIPQQRIELDHGIGLPKIYDTEVSTILDDLNRSLSAVFDQTVVTKNENIQHRQSYFQNRSFIYSFIPDRILIGNTYNFSLFSYYNQAQNFISYQPVQQNNAKDKKKESNIPVALVVTVALAVIGTCCYYIGKSVGEINAASQDMEDADRLKSFIDDTETQLRHLPHDFMVKNSDALLYQIGEMKKIAASKNIFAKIEARASWNLKLRVSLAAGAAIAAVGALLGSVPVMAVGGAVCFFTACLMLATAGFGSDKSRLNRDVAAVQKSIAFIQQTLAQVSQVGGKTGAEPGYFYQDQEPLASPVYFPPMNASAPPLEDYA